MKYMIVGAGAMGCLYGARLHKSGQEVALIASREATVLTIREKGVRLKEGETEESLPIPAYLAEDYEGIADVVLVFTKSIHSEQALASVSSYIDSHTHLVSFQNGIGNETLMKEYVDEDHIIVGTTNFPSDRVGEGQIVSKGNGVTSMMTLSGNVTGEVKQIFEDLKEAGLNPQLQGEIFRSIWEKVAFNAALNSLTAVTLVPQGYMGQTKEGKELAHAIVHEVCSVACLKGIRVREDAVHETVDNLLTNHFHHCPSMLQDVQNRRMTEIESINGAVVREAEKLGIEVPVTKVLYYLVSIAQQTYEHRL